MNSSFLKNIFITTVISNVNTTRAIFALCVYVKMRCAMKRPECSFFMVCSAFSCMNWAALRIRTLRAHQYMHGVASTKHVPPTENGRITSIEPVYIRFLGVYPLRRQCGNSYIRWMFNFFSFFSFLSFCLLFSFFFLVLFLR